MAKSTGNTALVEAEAAVPDLVVEANVVPPMRQNKKCLHRESLSSRCDKQYNTQKEPES
jgi:hypothetical protein